MYAVRIMIIYSNSSYKQNDQNIVHLVPPRQLRILKRQEMVVIFNRVGAEQNDRFSVFNFSKSRNNGMSLVVQSFNKYIML